MRCRSEGMDTGSEKVENSVKVSVVSTGKVGNVEVSVKSIVEESVVENGNVVSIGESV